MKNFQKYPKWIKEEYVKRAIEKFANHKVRLVLDNERLFMIDWQWENGEAANEMRCILDKEHGVFIMYGDLGEVIAYFNCPIEVEDLLSYMYMCSYDSFAEKIVAKNPYDIVIRKNPCAIDPSLGAQEIKKRISKVHLWVMGFFMACEEAGLRG